MEISKEVLFKLSTFTLFGFSALGILIILQFQDVSLQAVLLGGTNWFVQIIYGLCYGVFASVLALTIIRLQLLAPITNFYQQLFSNLDLRIEDILFYSFCAGVGEEVFFRAALQPFMGIWITSIIFVSLHGYLDPRNWRMLIYGILMVIISAGIGYLFQSLGLVAAISSHFTFDVVMFSYLIYFNKA